MRQFIVIALGAAALSIAAAPSALAADMPVKVQRTTPYYNWTGWYAGLNVGRAWGNNSTSNFGGDPVFYGPSITAGTIPASQSLSMNGWIGGGQAGYNYQSGQTLFGIEADISSISLSGANTFATVIPAPSRTTTVDQNLNWLATLRGRLGYVAMPNWVFYVTGGLAVGDVKASTNVSVPPGVCGATIFCSTGSGSTTRAGWTAGLGSEYAIGQHWTIKAEYLYFDLGSISYAVVPVPFVANIGMQSSAKFTGNIGRIGVNYRF